MSALMIISKSTTSGLGWASTLKSQAGVICCKTLSGQVVRQLSESGLHYICPSQVEALRTHFNLKVLEGFSGAATVIPLKKHLDLIKFFRNKLKKINNYIYLLSYSIQYVPQSICTKTYNCACTVHTAHMRSCKNIFWCIPKNIN